MREDQVVKPIEGAYMTNGYDVSIDNALQLVDVEMPDGGTPMTATFLPYGRSGDSTEGAYVLMTTRGVERRTVYFILRTTAPSPLDHRRFEYVDSAGIWLSRWIPGSSGGDGNKYFPHSEAAEAQFCFGCCWLAGFYSVCAGSAVRCAVTGPGWVNCTATGCGAGAVGAGVGCLILWALN
jgi:hypothetical protein